MNQPCFHALPDGGRLAYRFNPGTEPALVFLPGYMSDMSGGKAQALFAHAQERGRACLLLDYSGCGASDGSFADGTLSRWRDEVLGLLAALELRKVALIGSSMGGWLMLLVAREMPASVAALVGLAAAPDFTDWGFDGGQKNELQDGRTVFEHNPYGPEPTPTYPGFWHDGQELQQLIDEVPLDCPVRLLHGQADTDVPWEISLRLAERLRSDDVQVVLIKDGDHRLSRPDDIAAMLRLIDTLP